MSWIESEPRTEGRVMNLVLAPGQRKKPSAPATQASPAAQRPASEEAPPAPVSGAVGVRPPGDAAAR